MTVYATNANGHGPSVRTSPDAPNVFWFIPTHGDGRFLGTTEFVMTLLGGIGVGAAAGTVASRAVR